MGNRGKTSPTGFTDSELLRRISRSGAGGADYKQLTRELGLGGGRERKEDSVDPAVGIVLHKKVGDRVAPGEGLATIHYNSKARAARAEQLLQQSYRIADTPSAEKRPLIHRVIAKPGEKN